MPCTLKEVWIANFKSLRDLKVPLRKFNVIVGPNASGKTNFLEFFKFLRKALVETKRPYIPYLEWWSYDNIVWERDKDLQINAKLKCNIDGVDVEYEISFGRIGELFRILHERFDIERTVSLEREGTIVTVRYDENFIRENSKQITEQIESVNDIFVLISQGRRLKLEDLSRPQVVKMPSDFTNLLYVPFFRLPSLGPARAQRARPFTAEALMPETDEFGENLAILILLGEKNGILVSELLSSLRSAIENFAILKHPNMQEVKSSSMTKTTTVLLEDSSNLNNILYEWFSDKHRLPERIETIILELFPDTQISFELTYEGKIYMKLYEKGVELDPPCLPDGLYKVLAILTAVELKPSLLALDEVENSLYKEALEYVIDELRASESTVLITTHSPLVVDIVKLEDLLICERTPEGTVLYRIKEPEKLRKKLAELKVTQSESWLYGEFK